MKRTRSKRTKLTSRRIKYKPALKTIYEGESFSSESSATTSGSNSPNVAHNVNYSTALLNKRRRRSSSPVKRKCCAILDARRIKKSKRRRKL